MRTGARVGVAATAIAVVTAATAAQAGASTGQAAIKAAAEQAGQVNDDAGLHPTGKGVISARGAAVKIPFTFTCPAGNLGGIYLQIVQAVDDGFASGGGGKQVTCTGTAQAVHLYAQANAYHASAQPFAAGPASVIASLDTYTPGEPNCEDCAAAPKAAPAAAPPPAGIASAWKGTVTGPNSPTGLDARAESPAEPHGRSEFHGTVTLT